jgi:steroid delta-isomerase-like uncharacterized protein
MPATEPATEPATLDPTAAALAYFAGWNRHDPDAIAATAAADFVYASDAAPGPVQGPDGLRAFAGDFLAAFPDLAFDTRAAALPDGRVVVQWTVTGTHQGSLMGLPASGRRFALRGCDVTEVAGGKVRRVDAYWDSGALFRQIGGAESA